MRIDDAVRERGFRRWYERQLIESHAYLVTGFLSIIMMAIALEVIEFRDSPANVIVLALIAAGGGGLFIFAWKQFTKLLSLAEALAGQAVCASCRAYGKFEVLDARDSRDSLTGRALRVQCRQCRHQWQMG